MPKTRQQKAEAVDLITEKLESNTAIYLTDYSGLSVAEATELRNRFREAGVEYRVLKNTLVRLAMERIGGYDKLFEQLNGPTAVAFSNDPSAPARVIKKFVDEDTEKPELKAAIIEGSVYDAQQLDVLAALKSKEELLSDIIGLLMAPATNVISALEGQGAQLAAILQTLAEREEA